MKYSKCKITMKNIIKQNKLLNRIIHSRLIKNEKNKVLITFDDGPSYSFTPLILDILKDAKIQSIFFVVGKNAEQFPNLIQRIHEDGHLIGNHSYSHIDIRKHSIHNSVNDIVKCQNVIYNIIGYYPKLFRPPMGPISLKSMYLAYKLNLVPVYWSADGGEWCRNITKDKEFIFREIISNISPNSIILLHDNNNNVPSILHKLIVYIKSNKYNCYDSISEFKK